MFLRRAICLLRTPNPKVVPYSGPISTDILIQMENKYSAHNYHPIPVVFSTAKGAEVTDPEGRKYLDFLSAYSAVNQGHCNRKVAQAAIAQMKRCTLSARAFHNDKFPIYAKFVTEYFGYDRVLPMNTGAEAVETAIKLCRKWAYRKGGAKGNPENGVIIVMRGNFHGRTTTIVSFSDDPESHDGYGPFTPGFVQVPYGDADALRKCAAQYKGRLCGVLVEPIQGEAGVFIPPKGYLNAIAEVCKEHKALFMADEVQTGIARTGTLLAHYADNVRPDIVIVAKALSAGFYPVSAVLADTPIMEVFEPGTHGSTFGGNPLACAIAMEALQVVTRDKLVEKSNRLGRMFRAGLKGLTDYPQVEEVRGRGLLNAVVFKPELKKIAYDVTMAMRDKGVLAKPTHGHIIRFSPPLTISTPQMKTALGKINEAFKEVLSKAK